MVFIPNKVSIYAIPTRPNTYVKKVLDEWTVIAIKINIPVAKLKVEKNPYAKLMYGIIGTIKETHKKKTAGIK